MSKDIEIVWREFKTFCSEKILPSDDAIMMYLDTCLPVSLDDGTFVLEVGNPFAREQIKTRFLDKMSAALCEMGLGEKVELVLNDSKPDEEAEKRAANITATSRVSSPKNGLNQNYIFSSFVPGKSNRLALAASLAVADVPGKAYNPLFIWGKVGLGKTHLMHAIGNHILNTKPGTKVLYVSAETFTNDLIRSIRENTQFNFKNYYRENDILMIDDVQFIVNKDTTQEEFFNTFNFLYTAGKQIVLSADSPPRDIKGLEERLVSRFSSGLVTDIQPPDFETRVAILQKKAELKNYSLPEDTIMFIAQNIPSNIRELEGALNRVVACSDFNKEPINTENVSVWLKDMLRLNVNGAVNIGLIQQLVAETFGISIEDLLSQNRSADLALARQVAMYIARNKTNESLQQIGYAFNKKDHTTVIHACKKIEDLLKKDLRVRSFVDNIVNKL
ncbi:MAG: chromosomal replication initiator protein DnaA [Synergistaceae bacterium]|nr:chromosomal replication initiator protein DnaA [Synergistaceae bacterium]